MPRQTARGQGAAILVVAHNGRISDRSDRMAALRGGRIAAIEGR